MGCLSNLFTDCVIAERPSETLCAICTVTFVRTLKSLLPLRCYSELLSLQRPHRGNRDALSTLRPLFPSPFSSTRRPTAAEAGDAYPSADPPGSADAALPRLTRERKYGRGHFGHPEGCLNACGRSLQQLLVHEFYKDILFSEQYSAQLRFFPRNIRNVRTLLYMF